MTEKKRLPVVQTVVIKVEKGIITERQIRGINPDKHPRQARPIIEATDRFINQPTDISLPAEMVSELEKAGWFQWSESKKSGIIRYYFGRFKPLRENT